MDADTDPTEDENGAGVVMPSIDSSSPDGSSSPETATVPIDFCGDSTPSEGYTGQFKVVSVDADNGSMDIVCVQNQKPAARGIKAAVASYGGQ